MSGLADVFDRGGEPDITALDPETTDSTMHYRWVRPANVARRKAQGYDLVLRSVHGVRLLNEENLFPEQKADDRIWLGDLVLMVCRKTEAERRKKRDNLLAETRLDSQSQKFLDKARQAGVKAKEG